jgi:hypothetical protein
MNSLGIALLESVSGYLAQPPQNEIGGETVRWHTVPARCRSSLEG